MAKHEGARYHGDNSQKFICVGQFPDVCKLPNGTPVPFSIVAWFDDSKRYSPNVNFGGKPAMTMNGRIKKVKGDEPGKGGGVISTVNKGYCIPITSSPTVKVNGEHVLYRDETLMWMNCRAPDAKPGNTIGKVIFHGKSASANLSGGDSDPPLRPETPAEQGCWGGGGSQGDLAGGLLGDLGGAEGIVGLAQQAAQLAQTDWSNPGAVLGALGGVAAKTGLGGLADGLGFIKKGYDLAKTDWRNPTAALGALGGLAANVGATGLSRAFDFLQKGARLIHTDWRNPKAVFDALKQTGEMTGLDKRVPIFGDAPPPGAAKAGGPPVWPETAAEKRHASPDILDKLFGDSKGVVGIAHSIAKIAKTDWRSPASVLGSLSDVSTITHMGNVSKALDLLRDNASLIEKTDWRDPAAALGAAGKLADHIGADERAGVPSKSEQRASDLRDILRDPAGSLGKIAQIAGATVLGKEAGRVRAATTRSPLGRIEIEGIGGPTGIVLNPLSPSPGRPKPASRTASHTHKTPPNDWLSGMADNLFRAPEALDIRQLAQAPRIDARGRIVGDTDPRVRAESREEVIAGVAKTLVHNPVFPDKRPVPLDPDGNWTCDTNPLRPETAAETHYMRSLEPVHA